MIAITHRTVETNGIRMHVAEQSFGGRSCCQDAGIGRSRSGHER